MKIKLIVISFLLAIGIVQAEQVRLLFLKQLKNNIEKSSLTSEEKEVLLKSKFLENMATQTVNSDDFAYKLHKLAIALAITSSGRGLYDSSLLYTGTYTPFIDSKERVEQLVCYLNEENYYNPDCVEYLFETYFKNRDFSVVIMYEYNVVQLFRIFFKNHSNVLEKLLKSYTDTVQNWLNNIPGYNDSHLCILRGMLSYR